MWTDLGFPTYCDECQNNEPEDFIDGKAPCKSARNGFNCKAISDADRKRTGLKGNPWMLLSAGGISRIIEIGGQIISMSKRDARGLPSCDAMSYWSGEVPYSEDEFWAMLSTMVTKRKSDTIAAMERK